MKFFLKNLKRIWYLKQTIYIFSYKLKIHDLNFIYKHT